MRRAMPSPSTKSVIDGKSGRRAIEMTRQISIPLYVAVLIAVVVGVDVLFFRNRFWERLLANIGIVLVFAAFYLRFWRNP
jgi:lipopolysaccharide export LptBFGC system permease protein LptF